MKELFIFIYNFIKDICPTLVALLAVYAANNFERKKARVDIKLKQLYELVGKYELLLNKVGESNIDVLNYLISNTDKELPTPNKVEQALEDVKLSSKVVSRFVPVYVLNESNLNEIERNLEKYKKDCNFDNGLNMFFGLDSDKIKEDAKELKELIVKQIEVLADIINNISDLKN